jgi:hypothetical protein
MPRLPPVTRAVLPFRVPMEALLVEEKQMGGVVQEFKTIELLNSA